MFFNLIIIGVGLAIASVEDIKKREVPDIVSFSLIGLGLLLSLAASFFYKDFLILAYSIAGIVVAAFIGSIFYYSGQWGGGDFKILMGIGSLIGFNFLNFTEMPLLILFIINIFLAGAVIGVGYILFLAVKNWKKFRKEFSLIRTIKKNKKIRKIYLLLIPILLVLILLIPVAIFIKFFLIILLIIMYFSFYFSLLIKAVEKSSMIKKINVSELTEGDWLAKDIILKSGKKFSYGKTGLTLKDISILRKNNIKKVVIKNGMPFIPSFFVAYILTFIFGNWFLILR